MPPKATSSTLNDLLPDLETIARQQDILDELHQLFKPEPGQIIMGRQVFSEKTIRNWFQFGRDSGKSYGGAYIAVRYAALNARKYAVHVFPERNQGQKALWDSGYLRDKIPKSLWLDGDEDRTFNKSELLVRLNNGSRIQIFGADAPDTILRGPKPDLCNFDEFRDFRAGVYDIMEANLIGKILNIISTPPDQKGEYTELVEMFKEEIKAGNRHFFYQELPTYVASSRYAPGGPLHEHLMGIKKRLYKRGEQALWQREYEAKFRPGGVGAVFKKYHSNKRQIERDLSFLKLIVKEKGSRLDWHCVCDPSQNGTFAVLYAAVDREAGCIYVFGEEAVSDNSETGSLDMWARMCRGMDALFPYPSRWKVTYDEEAAWFYNDLDRHGLLNNDNVPEVGPTHKSLIDKNEQMSFMKDLFASRGRVYIARSCEKLIHQIENYVTNKKGEYHKDQPDDFIDTFRYLIAACDFQPFEVPSDVVEEEGEPTTHEGRMKQLRSLENVMTGDLDGVPDDNNPLGDDEFPYDQGEFY